MVEFCICRGRGGVGDKAGMLEIFRVCCCFSLLPIAIWVGWLFGKRWLPGRVIFSRSCVG